jgi:hypothetical protein
MILNLFEMQRAAYRVLGIDAPFLQRNAAMLTEQYAPNWFQAEARATSVLFEQTNTGRAQFDVFLSHAYRDKAVVIGTYLKLKDLGFTVYVDWIHDAQLDRSSVGSATADLLRKRMRQSKSLLYLATSSADQSKWMPWECGYYDAFDRTPPSDGHVAILPVLEETQATFQGAEYLGLYCWADVATSSYPGSRALEIHRPKSIRPTVRFDTWIGGTWP